MASITRLKLNKLMKQLQTTQGMQAEYTDKVVDLITNRCTEVDTGARNIDHIMRATLVPQLSQAVLEQMAEGATPNKVVIDINENSEFSR
jgi:type VI secretion system protein VasG